MSTSGRARILRIALFGLFLAPLTALGAITSLTPFPKAITMYGYSNGSSTSNGKPRSNSAPIVVAAGSSSATLTVSTSPSGSWLSASLLAIKQFDHGGFFRWRYDYRDSRHNGR